jgi:hypothetical protein
MFLPFSFFFFSHAKNWTQGLKHSTTDLALKQFLYKIEGTELPEFNDAIIMTWHIILILDLIYPIVLTDLQI